MKYLVEKGADINAKGRYDSLTVLHYAAGSGNLDLVKYLVEKGADVNAKGCYDSWTVLHQAAKKGNLDLVKYLVEKGADVNAEDGYGRTPADAGNWEIKDYLKSK